MQHSTVKTQCCASCCLRFAFCPWRCLAARAPKPVRKARLKGLRCRFRYRPSTCWSRWSRLRRQHPLRSPNHRRRPRQRHREPRRRVQHLPRNPSRRRRSLSHRRLPPSEPRELTAPSPASGANERSVRDLLTRASRDLNRVDYMRLSTDSRAQYEQSKRFSEQAEQALKERNLIFAATLADKAATLAAELLGK